LIRSREPLRFVAEWLPHAVVPSLSSLVELREGSRRGDAEGPVPEVELVAVGAPDLSRPAASESARGLGALPGAEQEIRALGELFGAGALALTGTRATEAAVRAAMPRGRYVHFATHALLDRRFPMSSSLVLSAGSDAADERDDGLLHGWEIFEVPALAAELVTLAGCETGRGAEWEGEGLIGLAQAFHYVGTPAVLASQWRVGDAWVGELTSAFYSELLAGRDPMQALAAAQRRMIARSHPYYWAAFTLFGVGEGSGRPR
jgi:CHAT domain-containing protein